MHARPPQSEGHRGIHRSVGAVGAGKDRAVPLFERLAEAEAAIHDMPIERVHLHEVGALDSIIDIVGAVYRLRVVRRRRHRRLAAERRQRHGPVCARHVPGAGAGHRAAARRACRSTPARSPTELVTPTGALIVTGYAREFGPLPAMRVDADRLRRRTSRFPRHAERAARPRRRDRATDGGRARSSSDRM